MKFNYKSRKGFTLIELLVVIGILAVLAAIAIPSVAGLIDRANVSSDTTNSNEMTNALERFVSEYELYCQDIANGTLDIDNLDSAQGRVYNSTGILNRSDITSIESEDGFNGLRLNKDTKYPENYETSISIIQNYIKTSSSTFEPKQSDCHYFYSPECGIVICIDANASTVQKNNMVVSGKNAKGQSLTAETFWIDLTEESMFKATNVLYFSTFAKAVQAANNNAETGDATKSAAVASVSTNNDGKKIITLLKNANVSEPITLLGVYDVNLNNREISITSNVQLNSENFEGSIYDGKISKLNISDSVKNYTIVLTNSTTVLKNLNISSDGNSNDTIYTVKISGGTSNIENCNITTNNSSYTALNVHTSNNAVVNMQNGSCKANGYNKACNIYNSATVKTSNVTFNSTVVGYANNIYPYNIYQTSSSILTEVNDCTLIAFGPYSAMNIATFGGRTILSNSKCTSTTDFERQSYAYPIRAKNSEITINNCDIYAKSCFFSYTLYFYENTNVTINGGNYYSESTKSGASVYYVSADSHVGTINGGTFEVKKHVDSNMGATPLWLNANGTINVNGSTFKTNKTYVAILDGTANIKNATFISDEKGVAADENGILKMDNCRITSIGESIVSYNTAFISNMNILEAYTEDNGIIYLGKNTSVEKTSGTKNIDTTTHSNDEFK